MKLEGHRQLLAIIAIVTVLMISGFIEAGPHVSESVGDLLIDAAILAAVVGISLLLARLFRKRGAGTR